MFDHLIKHIKSHYPDKDKISLHEPVFLGNEIEYLKDCIGSTFVSYHGPYVKKFEQSIQDFTGSEYCISMVSGTSALHISMVALAIDETCEVITQGLSFVATANAISYSGASPVFLDIDKENLGLSVSSLETYLKNHSEMRDGKSFNRITGKRIGACIPVHVFGHACDIEEIVACCREYNIPVIEDAAEALGSFKNEKHLGTFGEIGTLSFNGNKIVTTGGGGAVITSDESLAREILHLSTTAKVPHSWEYRHDKIGYNYRMPNVNAAVGLAQLEKLDVFLKSKKELANKYRSFFESEGIEFIKEPEDSRSNYWLNAILFDDIETRDAFLTESHEQGVLCRPAWQLTCDLPMYANCFSDEQVNARYITERLVNIPSSPTL